jgi:hypothetical protein
MNKAKSAAGFVPSFDELWGEDWAHAGPGVAIVLVNVGGKVYDILCDLSILYKALNEVWRVKDEDTTDILFSSIQYTLLPLPIWLWRMRGTEQIDRLRFSNEGESC